MPTYVVLLRAVNVAGRSPIRMPELVEALSRAGYPKVRTCRQSGNLLLEASRPGAVALETQIEGALRRELRLATTVLIRSAAEWSDLVAANPFPDAAAADPGHLVVGLLKGRAGAEAWAELQRRIVGRERVQGAERHAYFLFPDGIGRSKLTNALIERVVGTPVTLRNWNTTLRLWELARAHAGPAPSRRQPRSTAG